MESLTLRRFANFFFFSLLPYLDMKLTKTARSCFQSAIYVFIVYPTALPKLMYHFNPVSSQFPSYPNRNSISIYTYIYI